MKVNGKAGIFMEVYELPITPEESTNYHSFFYKLKALTLREWRSEGAPAVQRDGARRNRAGMEIKAIRTHRFVYITCVVCYNTRKEVFYMLLSNTENIGRPYEVLSLVTGCSVLCKNIGRDIGSSFKNLVGGEMKAYAEMLDNSHVLSLDYFRYQIGV